MTLSEIQEMTLSEIQEKHPVGAVRYLIGTDLPMKVFGHRLEVFGNTGPFLTVYCAWDWNRSDAPKHPDTHHHAFNPRLLREKAFA